MAHELQLDPDKVLKSPWLWNQRTVQWAEDKVAARAKDAELEVGSDRRHALQTKPTVGGEQT